MEGESRGGAETEQKGEPLTNEQKFGVAYQLVSDDLVDRLESELKTAEDDGDPEAVMEASEHLARIDRARGYLTNIDSTGENITEAFIKRFNTLQKTLEGLAERGAKPEVVEQFAEERNFIGAALENIEFAEKQAGLEPEFPKQYIYNEELGYDEVFWLPGKGGESKAA